MNDEKNDFALVPRPTGALEKAESGAKRVLSGMVKDTLALVKQGTLSILIGGFSGNRWSSLFQILIESQWKNQYSINVSTEQDVAGMIQRAERQPFDLFLLNTPEQNNLKPYETSLADLKNKHGKPIIVWGTEVCRPAGADFYLNWPTWVEDLLKAVTIHLNEPRYTLNESEGVSTLSSAGARPRRIIVLDDEPMLADLYQEMLIPWFKHVVIRSFANGDDAWREISGASPDLLITDRGHIGMGYDEILARLSEQKKEYPVFVISGFTNEEMDKLVNGYKDRGLDVTLLAKPFGLDEFYWQLLTHLGLSDHVLSTLRQ
ncbi:MAG TPA: response regulator [Candidatus Aquilonibacter sp.]|nr:response regulator [Candidatus Aquilonibacter sp.]